MTEMTIDRRSMMAAVAGTALASAVPAAARSSEPVLSTGALQSLIDSYVSAGRVPGAVVALVTPGKHRPQFLSAGTMAFGGSEKATPDSLWRVYSMSKPITAMAIMQRVATGELKLDQPVSEVLPEFAGQRVLVDPAKGLDSVPTDKVMTFRHLLTHTSGLSYAINGEGALEREYRRVGVQPGSINGFLRPGDAPLPDLTGMVTALAGLPLWQAPGTGWRYSVGLDVAGAALERLTGQGFDKVLDTQLFGPLGMKSTGFWAREPSRLADNYAWFTPDGRLLDKPQPIRPIERDGFTTRPKLLSGGGGLVASARDYARFAQMLLNEGEFEGRTVMPRGTARLAMSNLMPQGLFFEGRNGFGAGGRLTLFDTRNGDAGGSVNGSPAEAYGWGGAAGTLFMVDRVRQLAVVVMLQFMPFNRFPLEKDMGQALNRDAASR
ncbi:serine hydrolase domain-containing protein [Sandarakinorhabdus sp.]|uniref:serine hydrolase domain-containing protein n=1 Tax=Sandarakinorhabdus sp. TaxID=1916663 RepID=UPI00286DF016|nr:serine hydrolase domain-containing protein [Sandarakinorhabdus sp.]